MNYVDSFEMGGVNAAQIPCIKGKGAPTTATDGAVGCMYMDTDTGNMYKCTAVNNGVHIWVRFESGGGSDCHIQYIDGTNATPPLALMDLEPGSYVLTGTFAYSNNPENGQYPFANTLVQIDELDEGQKTVSFQVADEIICIFFTYDSYEFKRYCLADVGNGTVKTVNGIAPDENGNVEVETGGNIDSQVKIEGTPIEQTCTKFAKRLYGTDRAESFLFFTDPHLVGLKPHEAEMHEYIKVLKTYYDATPTAFVVCGGDWLEDEQTIEEACYKLGYSDSFMRANFDHYYCVAGNHDDNSYGVDDTGVKYTGTLPHETVRMLIAKREENLYYSFDGDTTKCYILDSASTSDAAMTDYKWGQIAWLAEKLKADDAPNSAIFIHAGFRRLGAEAHQRTLAAMANNLTLLCSAYNNGSTVTLNGVTYDFTECSGCMRFILSGHMHNADGAEIHNGIPVISTYDMRMGNTPTFDLCVADYDNNVIHMHRVGSGSDRSVPLGCKDFTEAVYTVTKSYSDNVNDDNTFVLVKENSSYTNKIALDYGYSLQSLTVTMGGVDITESAYSDGGTIYIDSVTGNIEITVIAEAPNYTNLIDLNSADYTNDGYLDDGELVSGGWYHKGSAVVTNFIPIEQYDILRIKGFDRDGLVNGRTPKLVYYDANKEYVATQTLQTKDLGTSSGLPVSAVENENGVLALEMVIRGDTNEQFTYKDVATRAKYVRINALRVVPEYELIVTVNEKIFDTDGEPGDSDFDGGNDPIVPGVYTNLVPTALDEDGITVYNSPHGYKNGGIISNYYVIEKEAYTEYVSTGFIQSTEANPVIYVKGSDWVSGDGYCRFHIFSAIGVSVALDQTGSKGNLMTPEQLGDKYWKFTCTNFPANYWCRISLKGNVNVDAGEELIITFNEPIE